MPLSKLGQKILRNFRARYGKKEGENFFYAWEHKHKKGIIKK